MIFRFTIPDRLPSLNEVLNEAKTHFRRYALLKKEQTNYCAWYMKAARIPVFSKPIRLEIAWIEKNLKRDIDNVASGVKFILDGLVFIGAIKNDTRQWIKEIRHLFPDPDKGNPRIEVQIEELQG